MPSLLVELAMKDASLSKFCGWTATLGSDWRNVRRRYARWMKSCFYNSI